MRNIRALVTDWLPPMAVRQLRRFLGRAMRFEGEYSDWGEAEARCTGYDARNILDKVLAATLKVKQGEAAFERDSVLFGELEYSWPVLTGLLWAAARNGGTLNVLDFGGALGSSYFQNRKFLQALPEVRWGVVEQAHYVDAGRTHVEDESLRFYKSIGEYLGENKPDAILLSSVLQYLKSPDDIFGQLSSVGASVLIIDRTPFSKKDQDRITIQRAPKSIYAASYPMWVFSESLFRKKLLPGWNLMASTPSPEGRIRSTKGLEISFQGLLLEAR